jgi:hypothetical protein
VRIQGIAYSQMKLILGTHNLFVLEMGTSNIHIQELVARNFPIMKIIGRRRIAHLACV